MPELSATPRGPAAPLEELATRAEVPDPGPVAPRDPNEPTRVFREASTPGPQAADRATQADPAPHLSAAAPSRFPAVPGYTLEGFVGRGGMGFVYRGTHHATGRTVALKLITPRGAGDETARARFEREVHALAAIKHPNIVPVYDAGEWHGFPYCTMEYVAGGNLSAHLDRIRADRAGAVALVAKVARAVERLHAEGILHRDIKPLNILLGENDEPLVADFGLAKWMDEESDLTISHVAVGTRPYMAPEQTLGRKRDYTTACDVWALGVTLYEVLTGRRPFPDDSDSGVYHHIRSAEPQPMTELVPDLPAELQSVVAKCLAKRPEDRYPTAAALADDLDRWLRREPVLAPPPVPPAAEPLAPLAPAAKKPRRRARLAVTAVAVTLLALAAGAVASRQSIEKRLAAGKPVRLTDDKGRPLVQPTDEPEFGLQRDTWAGYHSFSRHGVGITNFIDVPMPEAYAVEADIAVGFSTIPGNTGAGIYVGRQSWPGLPYQFTSVATASVAPKYSTTANQRELRGLQGLLVWGGSSPGTIGIAENSTPWGDAKDVDKPRFARVRLEVYKGTVHATIDGVSLRPYPLSAIAKTVNVEIWDRRGHDQYQEFTADAPVLGNGIGVYCINNTCVIRNLTVTKLAP